MSFETWLAFAAASAVLVAIPGPTVMLVVGYALGHGRGSVAATAPGVALGDLLAMSASMLGVGALLAASASLFTAVKIAGAIYLAWLGIKMWRASMQAAPEGGTGAVGTAIRGSGGRWRMFRDSFLVTLLNPKGLIFFIAFVPQFVTPEAPVAPQFAILIATFTTIGMANVILWGLAAGEMRARIARPGALRWINRAGGGFLIGAGAATALAQRV